MSLIVQLINGSRALRLKIIVPCNQPEIISGQIKITFIEHTLHPPLLLNVSNRTEEAALAEV